MLLGWLAGVSGDALGHPEPGAVVRPRHRPGAPAAPSCVPLRDDAALRRSARRAGHGSGPARDRRRRRRSAHPLSQVRGRLRLRARSRPRCHRPADGRRRAVAIKYAVVRDDPGNDRVPRRPAAPRRSRAGHQRHGRASGRRPPARLPAGRLHDRLRLHCARRLQRAVGRRATRSDWEEAEELRAHFMPLEDLRDAWGPARVLHHATELAGIAPTGPIPPFVSPLDGGASSTSSRPSRARSPERSA